jgi:hypothetical protein
LCRWLELGPAVTLGETGGLPRHRRRLLVATALVVILAGTGTYLEWTNPYGISVSHPLGVHHHAAADTQDNAAATATRTVERRTLSQTTAVSGTLGYAGDYTVLGQAHGTVTWLPTVGQVIRERRLLYRVDGNPVVLLYGSTPAYRDLAAGAEAADVTGADVRQLNHDLVELGYVSSSELGPNSDEFSWASRLGVQRLQDALGVAATGELALGSYVFEQGPVRVTALSATLGGPAGGPILKGTSTTRQVTVDLDAGDQSEVKAGDEVSITLPDNRSTPGTVTSASTVATVASGAGADGSAMTPTIGVTIAVTNPATTGTLDQAPVQVAITTDTVRNALAVPVNALLALSSGTYAVEVIDTDGTHHLIAVSLGLFDDAAGLVQASGSDLAAGQRVVVPAS